MIDQWLTIENAGLYHSYKGDSKFYDEARYHDKQQSPRTVVKGIEPHLENNWECEATALNNMKDTHFAPKQLPPGESKFGGVEKYEYLRRVDWMTKIPDDLKAVAYSCHYNRGIASWLYFTINGELLTTTKTVNYRLQIVPVSACLNRGIPPPEEHWFLWSAEILNSVNGLPPVKNLLFIRALVQKT